ncbi:MAG: hypothetical protein ACI90V_012477, partial [Bacillariaceae sp.]|jgi:hypothetical protein
VTDMPLVVVGAAASVGIFFIIYISRMMAGRWQCVTFCQCDVLSLLGLSIAGWY